MRQGDTDMERERRPWRARQRKGEGETDRYGERISETEGEWERETASGRDRQTRGVSQTDSEGERQTANKTDTERGERATDGGWETDSEQDGHGGE